MNKRLLLSQLFIIFAIIVYAQKITKVSATYTYYAPETMSIEEAKRVALDRAKIDAIEKEFGSHVSQINATSIETTGTNTKTSFSSIGGSEIMGEWIETIGEPSYNINYIDSTLIVTVAVKGCIRELTPNSTEFDAKILRNGIESKFEDYDFLNGDEMYLSFCSPVYGYLLVYLLDSNNRAYRLLPYRKQQESSMPIEKLKTYVFFHRNSCRPDSRKDVDEYVLTTDKNQEINIIYLIFSRNNIDNAIDYQINNSLPRELDGKKFQQWLIGVRKKNPEISLKEIPLTIKTNKQ